MKLLHRTAQRWSTGKQSGLMAIALLLTVVAKASFAHALWFDLPAVVKTGEQVAVKIYFGEYDENLRESTGGRLDNVVTPPCMLGLVL